jgi:hypothetical protein
MTLLAWAYDLCLRTKNSVGTPLHYMVCYGNAADAASGAPPIQPTMCGPIDPQQRTELQREGLDYSEDPILVGVRFALPVKWEERADHVRGSTYRTLGSSGTQATSLGTILSDLFTVGNYLEVSVDGGSTWRVCFIQSNIKVTSVTGKNVAVGCEITFAQKALRQVVAGVAAADW